MLMVYIYCLINLCYAIYSISILIIAEIEHDRKITSVDIYYRNVVIFSLLEETGEAIAQLLCWMDIRDNTITGHVQMKSLIDFSEYFEMR